MYHYRAAYDATYRKPKGSKSWLAVSIMVPVSIVAVTIAISIAFTTPFASQRTHTCLVTNKTVSGDERRVYTEKCGVFEVQDEALRGKYFSASRFAQIHVGRVYAFTTTGWRNTMFSLYPNIISVKAV